MKSFACGDVVPGCNATFVGDSVEDILGQIGQHAAEAHDMHDVTPEVVDQVVANIR